MRKILFISALLLPICIMGQGVNKFSYGVDGKPNSAFIGPDSENYTFKHFYSNGLKSESGRFKNGVKHGVWKTWDETGKLTSVAHYKNGEKTGKWLIKNQDDNTTFEISFNHNHMLHALKKDIHGHIVAKR
jgi:hypothetical protein